MPAIGKVTTQLSRLADEATVRFVGRGEIVDVALGGDADIRVFTAHADSAHEEAVRAWANTPVARPVIYTLIGCAPGERLQPNTGLSPVTPPDIGRSDRTHLVSAWSE
jgi:hypothetical protein